MPKYADVLVKESLLAKLKSEQEEAEGWAKYGRFKAWLHYANLKSWQEQGWHFNYLNYAGEELHCTCGLIVPVGATGDVSGVEKLKLDPVQRARGHRRLPSLKGATVAFIYDFKWIAKKGVYYYKAVCQECLAHTDLLPGVDADDFVFEHNKGCLSGGRDTVRRTSE